MKKCPTCQRTFEDSLRFCQADGTPLVADEPVDPYKTMVARPEDIASVIPPAAEPQAKEEEEVLQLPVDERKTMYVSEEEIRKEMAAADEQVIEIPPLTETPAPPEPPKFSEPILSPPSFGDVSPPPSPFSASEPTPIEPEPPVESPFSKTTPPIPSPFGQQKPASFDAPAPVIPEYKEPEPRAEEPAFNPFNAPAQASEPLAQAEWTPPPAPEASWQNQEIGQNTPFNPPPPGAGAGQNKTLAIVSLVLGIVSFLCCNWFIVGLAAVVTGFMAKSKADSDPANYGGRGLALGGIITGVLSMIIGILIWVLYLFTGVLSGILGNI